MRRWVWLTVGVVCSFAGLTLASCGGSTAKAPNLGTLTNRLPAASTQGGAVDLVAVRQQLGLPSDADPLKLGSTKGQRSLYFAVFPILQYAQASNGEGFKLDGGKILAAAYGSASSKTAGVTIISTSQSSDDLKRALLGGTYVAQSGAFDNQSALVPGTAWAVVRPGLIVFAPSRNAALQAAAPVLGPRPLSALARLLDSTSASIRLADVASRCVTVGEHAADQQANCLSGRR